MPRFIVRGSAGDLPTEQVERLRSASGVTVVDRSPRMVLLDGEELAIKRVVASMKDVTVHPEKTYSIPSPHPSLPKVKGPPLPKSKKPPSSKSKKPPSSKSKKPKRK